MTKKKKKKSKKFEVLPTASGVICIISCCSLKIHYDTGQPVTTMFKNFKMDGLLPTFVHL